VQPQFHQKVEEKELDDSMSISLKVKLRREYKGTKVNLLGPASRDSTN
jgi:hypothetical protein